MIHIKVWFDKPRDVDLMVGNFVVTKGNGPWGMYSTMVCIGRIKSINRETLRMEINGVGWTRTRPFRLHKVSGNLHVGEVIWHKKLFCIKRRT